MVVAAEVEEVASGCPNIVDKLHPQLENNPAGEEVVCLSNYCNYK